MGCTSFPNYGVDLNRNSSFKWNQCEGFDCSSGLACAITFRGSGPASEPEVQAFQAYVLELFPDQRGEADSDAAPADATGLFFTIHSYGRLVLYPWGWTQSPSPNATQLRTLGRKFGYHTGYAVCQVSEPGCIYQVDGSSDDWAYGELGVAAFTYEIGTTFFQSCGYFENTILEKNHASFLYAVKAARRPYQTPAGPDALDVMISAPAISPTGHVHPHRDHCRRPNHYPDSTIGRHPLCQQWLWRGADPSHQQRPLLAQHALMDHRD